MTDHSKATPRPWLHCKLANDADQYEVYQSGASGKSIAVVFGYDNAVLITESINNHDRLVEENKRLRGALKEIIRDMNVAMLYKRANKGVVVETQRIARAALEG